MVILLHYGISQFRHGGLESYPHRSAACRCSFARAKARGSLHSVASDVSLSFGLRDAVRYEDFWIGTELWNQPSSVTKKIRF